MNIIEQAFLAGRSKQSWHDFQKESGLIDDNFCNCNPEEKHGSTSAMHCNHCGKIEQSETWLKLSNPLE